MGAVVGELLFALANPRIFLSTQLFIPKTFSRADEEEGK
tara:strand:- start:479 stop:595 length:117 start_codon:yes stop_codon:yes gene_type:complete